MYVDEIEAISRSIYGRRDTFVAWMEGAEYYDWKDFCDNVMWIFLENRKLKVELGSDLEENLVLFNTICKALKR